MKILFLFCEHRIPRREKCRILLENFLDLGSDILLVDNETEHIFVKPLVGHDKMPVVRDRKSVV